eukprot:4870168-Amphidinium_carterae.1
MGFQTIYDGREMSLVIFLIPRGSKLPLHDHPGGASKAPLPQPQLQNWGFSTGKCTRVQACTSLAACCLDAWWPNHATLASPWRLSVC